MKKLYFFTLLCASFALSNLQAQTFVDQNATGANDGTSWADAYTNLSVGLLTAQPGDEVWVAAGTYKHIDANPDAFFTFDNDIKLYGGFAGTEATLAERDWEANPTILSGDHNGDDVMDDFATNRTDNSKHVMWLTDTITNSTLIDGFTFTNGNTLPGSASGDDRRGGGLFTYGSPTVRNCTFTQNYGYFGGGLYPRISGADGIVIENCTFIGNRGNAGGAIYTNPPSCIIRDCTFKSNSVDGSHGGAIYSDNINGFNITDCSFEDNTVFTQNRGGAIYISHSPGTAENCIFINNESVGSSGGAIMLRGDSDEPGFTFNVVKCSFEGNAGRFGGAIGCYDAQSTLNVVESSFKFNTSASVGGAATNGFQGTSIYTDCTFEGNSSTNSGGAIFNQNNGSSITLKNCKLNLNKSETTGGAIFFGGNSEVDSIPLPSLNIERCFFEENTAVNQGGAINVNNGNLFLSNSLIHNNFTNGASTVGGGISLNVSDTLSATYRIENSTIANNIGIIGSEIATWTGEFMSSSTLFLKNNIIVGYLDANFQIEDGTPSIVSEGGNLCGDASMANILTAMNDLNETDPLLVDPDSYDFRLQDMSPCIDKGIATGAPTIDLDGNPRIGLPDMGCYENQNTISTFFPNTAFGALAIFPNPVQARLNLNFENTYTGNVQVAVSNQLGQMLYTKVLDKQQDMLNAQIEVAQLPEGVYTLSVSNGKQVSSARFIK